MSETTASSQAAPANSRSRVMFASLVGTTIEFYDFYVYATAAVLVFPHLFFPSGNETAALLASFAIFGAAMVARPLGAVFFGHLGDKIGRKNTLIYALLTMGIATFLIGLLPTYHAIGWWAPLLGVAVVTLAISLMESLRLALVPWVMVTAVATYLGQLLGQTLSDARWAGAFLGAVVAILAATVVEFVRPQLPRSVVFLPSFWLLVPGSFGLISVTQLEAGPAVAFSAVIAVTLVIAAIALGIVVGASLAFPLRQAARRVGLLYLLRLLRGSRAR